jgi:hypothetical protein
MPPGAGKPQGLAVTSMVLGIVSFLICWIPYLNILSLLTAVGAVVLGFIARSGVAKGTQAGGGMALTGIILGIVYLALFIIGVILALVFGMAMLGIGKQIAEEAERQNRMNQTGPVEMLRMTLQYVSVHVRVLLS